MNNIKELIEELNSRNIKQTSEWTDSMPDDLWDKHFEKNNVWSFKTVAKNLDVNKHRWYELSTTVIELDGNYIGILLVSNVYSEVDSISDMEHILKFREMKQVQTITYIDK